MIRRPASALITGAFGLIIAAFLLGAVVQKAAGAKPAAKLSWTTTPSASTFAAEFVRVTNQYTTEIGDTATIGAAHCVQAAPGQYMCAYTVSQNGTSECHLMQARWTPGQASEITVTLAGRVGRCGSVREAIQSLR